MEFYIETGELQRAIKFLQVVAKVNEVGLPGRILIEANENNSIEFTVNSKPIAITHLARDVAVKTPGTISILYSKIKSFVTLSAPWNGTYGTKGFLFVAYGQDIKVFSDTVYEDGRTSKGKLKLDYFDPQMAIKPKSFNQPSFILNSNIFKTALSKIIYAIDPGETRPSIQGMNMRFDEENIYFAGTNGYVLSEYKVKNISNLTEGSFNLKYDYVMAVKRAVIEETQLFFEIDGGTIRTKFGDTCIYGSMVIGHLFPEYKKNLESYSNYVSLNKDVLSGILIQFGDVLDSDDYNRLTFSIKGNKLSVYNDYAQFEYDGDIEYQNTFEIDVNGVNMHNTVDAIKDDSILVKFSDNKSSLIFDSANFQDQKALILPISRR